MNDRSLWKAVNKEHRDRGASREAHDQAIGMLGLATKAPGPCKPAGHHRGREMMSERRVAVDLPPGANSSMPLQRHRGSLRGTRSPSSLESPPASRISAVGSLIRAPGVYVGAAPSGCIGDLSARVTRRALGISSVFLQGLRSSSLASVPAPGPERDHTAVENLGGCLVEYMTKVHALEQVSRELETQLRTHLESKAKRSADWDALRASWASSYQQVSPPVVPLKES